MAGLKEPATIEQIAAPSTATSALSLPPKTWLVATTSSPSKPTSVQ